MTPQTQNAIPHDKSRIVSLVLIICCLCFQILPYSGIALFLPLIRKDLGLSFSQGGSLSAATLLFYALAQIPAGYLADRYNPKKLLFIGVICTSCLMFALAWITALWQGMVLQALAGISISLLYISSLPLLARWFSPERRATAMGLSLVGIFGGTLVLDITGPTLATFSDWRFPMMVFASLGIITALLFLRFAKEPPAAAGKRKVVFREVLQLFRYRVMWVCGALQYVRIAIVQGIVLWLPSFLVDEKGLPLQMAGLLVAIQAGIIAPSSTLGGYISDRTKKPLLVIGTALVILAITTSLFSIVDNLALLMVFIGINALFMQFYFGPLFAAPIEILGVEKAGMSSGFSNLFANMGGFTFAYLLGLIKEHTGSFHSGFYTVAGVCVIGLALTVWLGRIRSAELKKSTL